jgi:hypothetical protein
VSIVPSVSLPPSTGLIPGAATYQSTLVVNAPTTVAVKSFVFAVPAEIVQEVGDTVTTGGGVIVTNAVAVTFMSSKEVAVMVTVDGDGAILGAWYVPLESIVPTVSLPPAMLFTFRILIEFVPPETNAENTVLVTTFTEMAAGDMVTEIPVTGSVQVEEDEELEVVAVVVVQVTAVLAGAVLHDAMTRIAQIDATRERRLTGALSLVPGGLIHGFLIAKLSAQWMFESVGSISTHLSNIQK